MTGECTGDRMIGTPLVTGRLEDWSLNGSGGTDHGTAGPVFLAGNAVRCGLIGTVPSLTDLQDGDLKVGMDFRRVYATVLEDWLRLPSQTALAGKFEGLPLFKS
jgi:uncharacterized protein (DUF1501 family)